MPQTFDVLIHGGTVYDGTAAPGVRADVGIRGERIAAVGQLGQAEAGRVIDASHRAVSPGFVDVHSHDDVACMLTPMDFKLMQGVTTNVVGNCGAGTAPYNPEGRDMIMGAVLGDMPELTWETFGEWLEVLAGSGHGTNVACLVPHGAVRFATFGLNSRAPTDAELDQMMEHINDGMAAGAVGLSTGLIYPPGAFARTDEIIACAQIAAKHGGIYVSHIRNEDTNLMAAVEEAITIGEQAGLPVQISHHKAGGPRVWGKVHDTIALMNERRAAGQDITFDVYPYTAASTVLSAIAAAAEGLDFDLVMIASAPGLEQIEGKTLTEAAQILGVPKEQAPQRVLRECPGATAIFFIMDEGDIRTVVSQPECMIGSDGLPTPGGKPHPRLYGTFPRVIQRYVREEGLLSLEEAVRKMTSLPADRFQLADRGRLVEGAFADVVVFDPQTIEDIATYQQPRQYPKGIDYVLVNGVVAAENGKQTVTDAGRLLRRGVA
ncbi:MAG: D-aminoacylase [Chloroflexota bacterium]